MEGRLQPVLLGGLFIGVLSSLPLVSAGNCCCCLWIIAGGALAAYLRQQNLPTQITAAEGLLVGLLAGLVGGILTIVFSIPMQMVTGPFEQQILDRVLSSNPDIPPETRDMLERAAAGGALTAFRFVTTFATSLVFGLLGGLLGSAVFKKTPPPPPPGTVEILPPQM
jgi:hypothetical protein